MYALVPICLVCVLVYLCVCLCLSNLGKQFSHSLLRAHATADAELVADRPVTRKRAREGQVRVCVRHTLSLCVF